MQGHDKTIRVLVVDDSALIRKLLTEILNADPELEVIATASDPYTARDKIKQHNPDVITLDIEMPRMDGLTFLRNLMRLRPMPVVMVSSLTHKGAAITMQALEEGAVDFIPKPTNDLYHNLEQYSDVLIAKVKTAMVYYHSRQQNAEPTGNSAANTSHADQSTPFDTDRIIAIGASTGGTEAIKSVLVALPSNMPPIVITQHLPVPFTTYFAQRLDRSTILNVSVAAEDETLLPGHVYLAPGDRHLEVRRHNNRYMCHLNDEAPVNRHKPSVDVLFNSLAECAGTKAIAVLLSGMGRDGAYGMAEMHNAGADTLAQDENSCVVWGMPGYATRLGCVDHVASPAMLPRLLIDLSACGDRAPHMPIGDSDNHFTRAPGNT